VKCDVHELKGRHFEGEIILWAVRWYCKYGRPQEEIRMIVRFVEPCVWYRPKVEIRMADDPKVGRKTQRGSHS
jgi:hypothetical protein